MDVGFFGCARNLCYAFTGKEYLGNLVPSHSVLAEDESLATQIVGQLAVGVAVSDDITVGKVVCLVVDILFKHTRSRLAVGMIILREVAVDELFIECYSLAFESLQYEIMYGPKRFFGERSGSEAVLIAHHDKFEVEILADESKIAENSLREFQLPEFVNLFVCRLFDESSVSVDE